MKLDFVSLGQTSRPAAMNLPRGTAELVVDRTDLPFEPSWQAGAQGATDLAAATATRQAALPQRRGEQGKGAMAQVSEALPGVQVRSRPGPAPAAGAAA